MAFRTCRPLTIHFISAGGFDGAVVHCSGTGSPTLASEGPDIDTCVGATVWAGIKYNGKLNQKSFLAVRCAINNSKVLLISFSNYFGTV